MQTVSEQVSEADWLKSLKGKFEQELVHHRMGGFLLEWWCLNLSQSFPNVSTIVCSEIFASPCKLIHSLPSEQIHSLISLSIKEPLE